MKRSRGGNPEVSHRAHDRTAVVDGLWQDVDVVVSLVKSSYASPVGRLTLVASETGLRAVRWPNDSSPNEARSGRNEVIARTAEQLDQIVATVSAAPVEVKRAFESEVNIFGGGLDNYVPADSNVTVAQRRALVAVGAVLVAAPAVVGRRK